MTAEAPRVVLVETTHPGNIGATARAMKTMGLRDLALVNPRVAVDHPDAVARASGAADILESATVCPDLDTALASATWVLATTARVRESRWPSGTPREAAAGAAEEMVGGGRVALIFGREKSGLTNEEVQRAHSLIHIPTAADYSSLNLAQAVQLVCYEMHLAMAGAGLFAEAALAARGGDGAAEPPAPAAVVEGLIGHFEQTALDLEFMEVERSAPVRRRLRRFCNRARPTEEEVNLLRGLLRAAQKAAGTARPSLRPGGSRRSGDDHVIMSDHQGEE
ncbi:MAG: RNA methyltransferase [Pseudomonadota bacterium]